MMHYLQSIDKGRQSAVCLERLHVEVRDEVHNSHSACHKLQATADKIIIMDNGYLFHAISPSRIQCLSKQSYIQHS